jgi:endonuclease/exonuclease/phosphatase family metal-dependent hydrolase
MRIVRPLILLIALAVISCVPKIPGVLEPAPKTVRVLVFNIHAGKDAAGASNLQRVAELVDSTDADIVLLQEVDRGTARSGNVDQVAALQQATGFDAAFGPSLARYDGGEYGIAVLSRWGIGLRQTTPLSVAPAQARAGGSAEPRVALLMLTSSRIGTFRAINTHLDPSDAQARGQEIGRLVGLFKEQPPSGPPIVVGGDFNATPDDAGLEPLRAAGLRDAWTECGSGDGFTYPADKPVRRIDYLFLGGELKCSSAQVIDTQVSDHRPVLVTLR